MIRRKIDEGREQKKYIWFLKKLKCDLHLRVRKLKKVERIEVYRYLVVSKLKEAVLDLEHIFENKRKESKTVSSEIDYIGHKISTLPAKIKFFELDYEKQEFKKICRLISGIVEELKDV